MYALSRFSSSTPLRTPSRRTELFRGNIFDVARAIPRRFKTGAKVYLFGGGSGSEQQTMAMGMASVLLSNERQYRNVVRKRTTRVVRKRYSIVDRAFDAVAQLWPIKNIDAFEGLQRLKFITPSDNEFKRISEAGKLDLFYRAFPYRANTISELFLNMMLDNNNYDNFRVPRGSVRKASGEIIVGNMFDELPKIVKDSKITQQPVVLAVRNVLLHYHFGDEVVGNKITRLATPITEYEPALKEFYRQLTQLPKGSWIVIGDCDKIAGIGPALITAGLKPVLRNPKLFLPNGCKVESQHLGPFSRVLCDGIPAPCPEHPDKYPGVYEVV